MKVQGDPDHPLPVESSVLGALDDAPEPDPEAATATVTGLLRGLLAEAQAQTALLTTIATNTTPAP